MGQARDRAREIQCSFLFARTCSMAARLAGHGQSRSGEAVPQVAELQVVGKRRGGRRGWRGRSLRAQRIHPMMARNRSSRQAADQTSTVRRAGHTGLTRHVERLRELVRVVPFDREELNSAIGLREAGAVAKQALKESKTIARGMIASRADRRPTSRRNSTSPRRAGEDQDHRRADMIADDLGDAALHRKST